MFKRFLALRWDFLLLFASSLVFFLSLGAFSTHYLTFLSHKVIAQTNPVGELVQKGIEEYNAENYQNAVVIWQEALTTSSLNLPERNIILENLARAYQKLNETNQAIDYWQQVSNNAQKLNNFKKLNRSLTEQAQIYLNLGQSRNAIALLCGRLDRENCQPDSAISIARQHQDILGEVAALGSLGEAYRLRGQYDLSIQTLEIALSLPLSAYEISLQQSLGKVYLARAQLWQIRANSAQQQGIPKAKLFQDNARLDYQKARSNLTASWQLSLKKQDKPAQMSALISLLRLAYSTQDLALISEPEIETYFQAALDLLDTLPNSIPTIYARIDLATFPTLNHSLNTPLAECPAQWQLPKSQRQFILKDTVRMAQSLSNPRAESFALGAYGHFYECRGQRERAFDLTKQAIVAANQSLLAKDSLYLWQWQKARLWESQGQLTRAKNSYQQAFNTLETIRNELLTSERDIQFDFKASIEPIYRQLAQLSLELGDSETLSPSKQKLELDGALKVIDSLRIAELQNYLGNDCILQAYQVETFKKPQTANAAIINSVIFAEKTAIIANLPDGTVKVHWLDLDRDNIVSILRNFRQSLIDGQLAINDYDTSDAQALYNHIIEPFKADFQQHSLKTLVFIPDGLFRNVPMAALYDGSKFLIEQYAIATTPSLQLTPIENKELKDQKALILGVTETSTIDGKIFPSLSNVGLEITNVAQQIRKSKPLVDGKFNLENLNQELDNSEYNLIHIATHAQFGTIAEDTFIVTGNNSKITIKDLESSLRLLKEGSNSIDLMFLTACQTATGDERSALGLAGVAVEAGVNSAIASLWFTPDESTLNLVREFYHNLVNRGMTKAEALQQAQIKLIQAKQYPEINDQYDNPAYWSSFILIGNWL